MTEPAPKKACVGVNALTADEVDALTTAEDAVKFARQLKKDLYAVEAAFKLLPALKEHQESKKTVTVCEVVREAVFKKVDLMFDRCDFFADEKTENSLTCEYDRLIEAARRSLPSKYAKEVKAFRDISDTHSPDQFALAVRKYGKATAERLGVPSVISRDEVKRLLKDVAPGITMHQGLLYELCVKDGNAKAAVEAGYAYLKQLHSGLPEPDVIEEFRKARSPFTSVEFREAVRVHGKDAGARAGLLLIPSACEITTMFLQVAGVESRYDLHFAVLLAYA
jgi:hypothetical protein